MELEVNNDRLESVSYTNQDLINKIKELNNLIEALKEEKNQDELLKFPWLGNLGHWYWNIKIDKLICNDKKITTLGYKKEEIPKNLGFEFFTSKLHPDDYERVMDNMRQHINGNIDAYEVEYRIQTKDGNWKWYYDRGKVTKYDEENKPVIIAGIVFDITEKKEMQILISEQNKRLLEIVNYDDLTQILNRRALFQKLKDQISKTDNKKYDLSVIMIDIDKFKSINDTYGHIVGDEVIKKVAETIKKNLSEDEFVGRYGGDEFLVVLPNSNSDKASIVAENIRRDVQNICFIGELKITISVGVRQYSKGNINILLDEADRALYEAKNNGRNKIVCY